MNSKYKEIKEKICSNGLVLLTPESEFQGSNSKGLFKCPKDHEWITRISTVLQKDRISRPSKGCPECANAQFKIKSDQTAIFKLLPEHTILSSYLKETGVKESKRERHYIVKCQFDHQYDKRGSRLHEGCPECSKKTFVGQERTRIIFQTQFNKPFPSIRPDWLKNPSTGRNLELDGYCEELKLAFEYQGRQHNSEDTEFGSDYTNQVERDQYKVQACLEHEITLVLIDQPRSYDVDKFLKSVAKDCLTQGIDITLNAEDLNFNIINDTNTLINNHKAFKDFAKEKGYTLITDSFSTMEDKLQFSCNQGHNFDMKGSTFKTMLNTDKYRNEPCLKCHKIEAPEKVKEDLSIAQCDEFAKQIGYECLSSTYVNINTLLNWKCNHGHAFSKTYRQMIRNQTGKYCPHCTELGLTQAQSMYKAKTIKNIENSKITKSGNGETRDINWLLIFASENNVQLVDQAYLGMDIKHDFVCHKGHNFSSTLSNLMDKQKRGTSLCNHKDCNGVTVIDLQTCIDFAKEHNWKCLSNKYKNVNEKMQWECDKGHIFEKSFRQFQRSKTGIQCPCC